MNAEIPILDDCYLFECAQLLRRYGQWQRAHELYTALLQKNLKNLDALYGLGVCLYHLSNWEAARRCFHSFATLAKLPSLKIWVGTCLVKKGDRETALKYLIEAGGVPELVKDAAKHPDLVPSEILEEFKLLFPQNLTS